MDVYEDYDGSSGSDAWYLQAHCHMRDDARLFRLDHIRAVRVLDTLSEDENENDEIPAAKAQKDDGATSDGTGAGGRRRRRRRSPTDGSSRD